MSRPSTFEFLGLKHRQPRVPRHVYWIRRAVALLVLLVLVGGVTFAAVKLLGGDSGPAPQTLKKAIWGPTEVEGESMFPVYRDLGVGIFQIQARWDQIAPTRPRNPTDWRDRAYEWPLYIQQTVNQASKHGMTVAIQLIATPRWARSGPKWTWPPDRPSDFADFAEAFSNRYPRVRHWMVWGEPNSRRAFGPVVDAPMTGNPKLNPKQARAPRLYAEMLDAAYVALKRASRRNLVIGGNTYLSSGHPVIRPYQWIRYLELPNGRRPRMDLWGHNPYSFRKPFLESPASPKGRVDFSDLDDLVAALDKTFPGPPLKLFLSEWGVPTGLDKDLQFEVEEDAAVKWVRSAFEIVREWDRIYTLGWVIPIDTERNPQGLLDEELETKPTYEAFKDG